MNKIIRILFILVAINLIYSAKLQQDISQIKNLIQDKQDKVAVTATMYFPVEGQCDKDPLVTACMAKINPKKASSHKWIAVSRDLLKKNGGKFNYGDTVTISNAGMKSGKYKVMDTMNKRFRNRIDFLETAGTKPYKFNNVIIVKSS